MCATVSVYCQHTLEKLNKINEYMCSDGSGDTNMPFIY